MATHSTLAGRYDEAIEQLQKTLELEPDFSLAHWDLSENYYYKGMYEESLAALKKLFSLWGDQESSKLWSKDIGNQVTREPCGRRQTGWPIGRAKPTMFSRGGGVLSARRRKGFGP